MSTERSTESEDGEIDRHKYRRSKHKSGHHSRHHHEKRTKKGRSDDLPPVNLTVNVSEEEEFEEVEDDFEEFDGSNEEGLDIKTPQQKASSSLNRSQSRNRYHRMQNERPFRESKIRPKDKHNRNKYLEERRSDDDFRRKRRHDDSLDTNVSKGRSEREKANERWMVLEDKSYPTHGIKSKVTDESHRWQRERHNKESRPSYKLADKSAEPPKDREPQTSLKQTIKKYNATIEVQEVETSPPPEPPMNEDELVGNVQITPSESPIISEGTCCDSEVSDVFGSEDSSDKTPEEEEQIIKSEESSQEKENDPKKPRIVVDKEVIYYPESSDVNKPTVDEFENFGDENSEKLPNYFPAIQGCRSVEEFQCINRIEEGTYGVVYRARDKKTNETVALKRLKMEKEKEGFPITSLREISTLLKAQHENIVTVKEIVVGSNMDKIYIVMEFVEHDLKSLMETMKQPFLIGEVKCLMQQLLRAVSHLHDNWILHRDLKTSNLLLSHKGILKVGDFGLAREYGSPLKAYTPVVVTLWYRAPELLLQTRQYSYPIDIWSVGCIFGELLTMKPLFPGKSEIDQLNHIYKELGTPNDTIWPGYSELPLVKKIKFNEHKYNNLHNKFQQKLTKLGTALMNKFLTYDPSKRITSEEALKHEFFKESPLPVDPSMFPTWPAKSELGATGHRKAQSPKPPSGGKQFAKQLAGDDDERIVEGHGFHMGFAVQGKASKGGGFNLKF